VGSGENGLAVLSTKSVRGPNLLAILTLLPLAVKSGAPSRARSLVTVLPPAFATQMSALSKITPRGFAPTENVPTTSTHSFSKETAYSGSLRH
jgi:hypothetical protein